MRHYLLAFITLCLVAMTSMAEEHTHAKKITVGYFDLPPHAFHKKSNHPSAALSYFDKITQEMGVEVEYIQYPLAHLVFLLDHQRLDAALILAKTEAREKDFVYPVMPFFTVDSVFVVASDSDLTSAKDIEQKSTLEIVVWQRGFHSPTLARSNNTLIPLSGNSIAKRGIELIENGRFDAFFSPDRSSIEYQIKTKGLENIVRILPIPEETIPLYTVFSKSAAKLHLKNYERALKKVSAKIDYQNFFINFQKNLPQPEADSIDNDATEKDADDLITQ